MSTKFTIETATDEQWLEVLDYIFETELSRLDVLADSANYHAFLDDSDIYYALEAGGVDNWSGYGKAIDLANSDGNDWPSLSNSEKLHYLYAVGIGNWCRFDKLIEDLMHELFTGTRPSTLNNIFGGILIIPKTLLEHSSDWHNFVARKCNEYNESH